MSLHIIEDKDDNGLSGIDYVTPSGAIGEIIECEIPGSMGKYIYEIIEVNISDGITKIQDILTGKVEVISNSRIPPSYDRFSKPKIGTEYEVYWIEHQNGRGEWVQTSGFYDTHHNITKERARYNGHEKTRILSKSYKHIPSGVIEFGIWDTPSNGNLEVHTEIELDQLGDVFNQVPDYLSGNVGSIYVKNEEIIWYSIDGAHNSPFDVLDNPTIR